jgi:hypothetical protein
MDEKVYALMPTDFLGAFREYEFWTKDVNNLLVANLDGI